MRCSSCCWCGLTRARDLIIDSTPILAWRRADPDAAVETRVALTYAGVWVIALTAYQAGRPDLIRSPQLVLAHVWEGVET